MGGKKDWILSIFGLFCVLALSPAGLGWQPPSAAQRPLLQYDALGRCTPAADWGSLDRTAAERVVFLTNDHRARLGLRPLLVEPTLSASAVWKSLHMGRFSYFDHEDPAPPIARTVFDRVLDCGYANRYVGEDIAAGQASAEETMGEWLASPGHRRVIENPAYSEIGVGVAQSSQGRLYWTLDLGRGRL